MSWRPTEAQGPSTNLVAVRVTDDGQPALSSTNTIEIVVREINQAPTLATVTSRRVSEGNVLSFPISAADADQPQQRLSFSVVSGPDGLTVTSSGQVTWRPSESQGPSTNQVQIRVTDDGSPVMSATNWVEIVVREVNTPPVLAVIGSKAVKPNANWKLQLQATDPDLPVQSLKYTLVDGPVGLVISTDGLINWTPTESQVGDHSVAVRVSDGTATDQVTFKITVAYETSPRLQLVSIEDSRIHLLVAGLSGYQQQLQSAQSVDGEWSNLDGIDLITRGFGQPVSITITNKNESKLFFRLMPKQF